MCRHHPRIENCDLRSPGPDDPKIWTPFGPENRPDTGIVSAFTGHNGHNVDADVAKLVTIAQKAQDESNPFTEPTIRWQVFNAETNGLNAAGAIVRIGRRVYLDDDAYNRWIEAQKPRAGAA